MRIVDMLIISLLLWNLAYSMLLYEKVMSGSLVAIVAFVLSMYSIYHFMKTTFK